VELIKAAERGDTDAQLRLAIMYANGSSVDQNDEQAARWFRAAAEQGSAQAQNELGLLYRSGHGVALDKAVAVQWWKKAAAQAYGPGLFNVGTAYFNGDGVGINDELAYAWFGLAAQGGDPNGKDALQRMEREHSPVWIAFARFKMAEMLERGDGVSPDVNRAKTLYETIAASNIPEDGIRSDAQLRIAQMYMDGRGVARDFQIARNHCEFAAKLNSMSGWLCLGKFAEDGVVGPPDYKQAARYYEQAAKYAYGPSLMALGKLCENGMGVKQDKVRALALYLIGEARMNPLQNLASERISSTMRDSEIKNAQKKIKEWYTSGKLP
jgi:hypothetical protein